MKIVFLQEEKPGKRRRSTTGRIKFDSLADEWNGGKATTVGRPSWPYFWGRIELNE